jgi:hypothetical protein
VNVAIELASERSVGGEQLAQAHEGADDEYAHGNGAWGVQHIGGLDRAMLGKGIGPEFNIRSPARLQGHSL